MNPRATHDEYLSRGFMPALDGVRAVAVLAVVGYHAGGGAWSGLNGDRGVQVFFALSGFLITTLCLREETKRGRLDVRAFAVRRIFRIMPLFLLVLATYTVAVLGLGLDDRKSQFRHALPYMAGYLPEWPVFHAGHEGLPFGVSWSLGIEEKFYLVWPIVAFMVLRRRSNRGLLAAFFVGVFWIVAIIQPQGLGQMVVNYSAILMGCVIAFVLNDRNGFERLSPLQDPRALKLMMVVVAGLWLTPLPLIYAFVPVYAQMVFLIPAAFLIAGLAIAGPRVDSLVPAILLKIGKLSYGIYLTHQLMFQVLTKAFPDLSGQPQAILDIAIGLPMTIVLCTILSRVVERPLIKVGHRLGSPRPIPAMSVR